MSITPRIFISAATLDFASVRKRLTFQVLKHGFHPIVEEGFEAARNRISLEAYLSNYLKSCSAMIHLAGLAYGSEAPRKSPRSPMRSWSQLEYHQAKRIGIPVMVCLARPQFYRGSRPVEDGGSAKRDLKAKLQARHFRSLQREKGIHYEFDKAADLDINVGAFLSSIRQAAQPTKTKILYIGAEQGSGFDLRGQLKRIRQAVSRAVTAGNIEVSHGFNLTAPGIVDAVEREQPSILHISGRQEQGTIMLHNAAKKLVPFDATKLADVLAMTRGNSLRLVILDTCYSMQQAKRLTQRGVPYAIGIYDVIADDIATDFYADFYSQIASGSDLQSALESARLLCEGSLSDPKKKSALESTVLEMPFDRSLHLPSLSTAHSLDRSIENFT